MYSAVDQQWMREALAQAHQALYLTNPNPRVGCVIVRDGQIIAKGHTQKVGGPHAEVQALSDLHSQGLSCEGASIYVTLEPCPMCAQAISFARIRRLGSGPYRTFLTKKQPTAAPRWNDALWGVRLRDDGPCSISQLRAQRHPPGYPR